MRSPVTIIIPTRNRQSEVDAALTSVVAQMEGNDEVLIIDDKSDPPIETDGHDGRVRIIRSEENRGPAGARNVGIRHARHEILAFLDSDDLWLEGKLAAQVELLDQGEPLIAVVSGWHEILDGKPLRKRIPRPAGGRSDHFEGCWFCPGSTLLIRKEAFSACGFYNEDIRRLEDYEWFLRFAAAGGRLIVFDGYGAVINRGRNNKPKLVEEAVSFIRRSHADQPDVTPAERRGMMAYLHLELAGSYRNAGYYPRMMMHIFTSLWYRPRSRIQMREWWT